MKKHNNEFAYLSDYIVDTVYGYAIGQGMDAGDAQHSAQLTTDKFRAAVLKVEAEHGEANAIKFARELANQIMRDLYGEGGHNVEPYQGSKEEGRDKRAAKPEAKAQAKAKAKARAKTAAAMPKVKAEPKGNPDPEVKAADVIPPKPGKTNAPKRAAGTRSAGGTRTRVSASNPFAKSRVLTKTQLVDIDEIIKNARNRHMRLWLCQGERATGCGGSVKRKRTRVKMNFLKYSRG